MYMYRITAACMNMLATCMYVHTYVRMYRVTANIKCTYVLYVYLYTSVSEAGGKVTVRLDTIHWRAKIGINIIHACGEEHITLVHVVITCLPDSA